MLYLFVVFVSLVLSVIRPYILFRGLLILSLALPTSNSTTHMFSVSVGTYHLLYTDFFLVLLFVPFIIKRLSIGERREPSSVIYFKSILFLFLAWTVCAIFIGLLQFFNVNQIIYDARPIFYYLIIFVAIDVFKSEYCLVNVSIDVILGLIIYCIITLSFVYLTTSHPFFDIFEESFYGFQGRIVFANDFYFLIALPLLIFIFRKRNLNYIFKGIISIVIVLFIIKVVITMSRTLIVLAFLSVLLSINVDKIGERKSYNNKLSPFFLIFTFIALVGFAVIYGLPYLFGAESEDFFSMLYGRFSNYNDDQWQETHLFGRTAMYSAGISEALKSPIWGRGYGYMFSIDSPEWYGKSLSSVCQFGKMFSI